jgi:SNF family Na+-dependent transporter
MIPYFISFLIVGIPICWAEWTMGRYGGARGFNSAPGIFSVLWRWRFSKYFGALGLLIPIVIYMYYVYLESWCLAYAWKYASGALDLGKNPAVYQNFFSDLTGNKEHGSVFSGPGPFGVRDIFIFFLITFIVNFFFVYRGLSKGIETFCKFAMPLLILAALVVVGRVLTLPDQPVAEPWHRSLAVALPAEAWQALRDKATAAETTAGDMQQALRAVLDDYFQQVKNGTAGYDPDLPVTPPAGFAATEAGIAVAMAELRAGDAGREYRDWIDGARERHDDETKLELQRLEREQLRKKDDAAGIGEIEASRARLLGEVPSLADTLESIKLAEPLNADGRQAVLLRAAALEVAELPRSVINGLGYMWNPDFSELGNYTVWIAATGQIFFSLSVGFGIVLCYASYLRPNDDIVLSGLTASTTNEFCEVILGGLVAIPATFLFLGTAMTLDVINSASTFGLGFNTLPSVFANMPAGRWFGAAWFGLLFLAGVTSSLSMLQPAIAFLEEGFGLRRRASVTALGLLTIGGALAVIYFSHNLIVLDTMDFWVGSVAIFVMATIQIVLFSWVIGIDRGLEEAHRGADFQIPCRSFVAFIMKYVTPTYLLVIFFAWIYQSAQGYVKAIRENDVALFTIVGLVVFAVFLMMMIALAGEQWRKEGRYNAVESET